MSTCEEKIAEIAGTPMLCGRQLPCSVHSTRPERMPDRVVELVRPGEIDDMIADTVVKKLGSQEPQLPLIDPAEPPEPTKLYGLPRPVPATPPPPPTSEDRAWQAFSKLKESINALIEDRNKLREENVKLREEIALLLR